MRPIALCISLLRPSTGAEPVLVMTAPRFDTATGAGLFDAVIGAIAKAEDWTTIVPGTLRIAVRPMRRKALGVGLSLDF